MSVALVDTSIWIAWFKGDSRAARLGELLARREAHVHPWTLGELRLGSGVPDRAQLALERAPRVACAPDEESWRLLHALRLAGAGIGWVDLQLLAAAHRRGIALWTADGPLDAVVRRAHLPPVRFGGG